MKGNLVFPSLEFQNDNSKNFNEKADEISPIIPSNINPHKEDPNSFAKVSKLEFSSQQSTKMKDENIEVISKKLSEEISDKKSQNYFFLKLSNMEDLNIFNMPNREKIKLKLPYSDDEKQSNEDNKSGSQKRCINKVLKWI